MQVIFKKRYELLDRRLRDFFRSNVPLIWRASFKTGMFQKNKTKNFPSFQKSIEKELRNEILIPCVIHSWISF